MYSYIDRSVVRRQSDGAIMRRSAVAPSLRMDHSSHSIFRKEKMQRVRASSRESVSRDE